MTKNNLEAAEEIVRQLRLRDVGGIIVIDFIDMVLENNRELVLRRLLECLGRDRTKHQVAEVTSLGLVQMTRKRVGQGLLEVFSETCEVCHGRGVIVHTEPVEKKSPTEQPAQRRRLRQGRPGRPRWWTLGRAGAGSDPDRPDRGRDRRSGPRRRHAQRQGRRGRPSGDRRAHSSRPLRRQPTSADLVAQEAAEFDAEPIDAEPIDAEVDASRSTLEPSRR